MSNAPCEMFRCRAESRKSAGPGSVMVSTPNQSGGPLAAGADTASATDPYILTLCCLAGPVTIRPPRAPQFKPFTFFTSRSRQADGSERVLLHMGYFATQKLAQKWAKLLRGPYPQAIATRAPAALLQRRDSAAPTLAPANATRTASPVMPSHHAPASDNALTDTQVFGILETRRVEPVGEAITEQKGAEISLLRPENPDTRRVLKEAVVKGAPVLFSVQLSWSVQPVDLASVPSLSIFRSYTLYATEEHRDGRSWYSLRLGFFSDAISAKQVALYVRTSFDSVAVVPISEEEHARAIGSRIDVSHLENSRQQTGPLKQLIDEALDSDRAPSPAPAAERTLPTVGHAMANTPSAPRTPSHAKSEATNSRPVDASPKREESIEETLEMLSASEMWGDADSAGETGVRHLQVDVQKRKSRRS